LILALARAAGTAFCALAGCAMLPPAEGPDLRFRLGQADTLAVPGALDATGQAFLGPDMAGTTGPGTGGLAGFDGGLLRGSSATAVRQVRSREGAAGIGLRQPLWSDPTLGRVVLDGSLHLGVSEAGWILPQGLGLFTDPMRIRVTGASVTPELRLVLERPLGPAMLEVFGGGAVTLSETRTEVRSALIALDNRHRDILPRVVLGAGLWHPLPGQGRVGVSGQVSGWKGSGVVTRIGLDLRR
jgi:hypothetical protein